MAKCSACGSEVSVWKTSAGLCEKCARDKSERLLEEKVAKLGTHPAHCIMVIKDAAWQPAILNLSVGDIFITDEAIVQIEYTRCTYTGNLGGLVASLAKGVTGAIGVSIMNANQVGEARGRAQAKREHDYGMTLEDRLRRHNGLVISRVDIQSIETDCKHGTIRIVYQEGVMDLAVGPSAEYQAKLHEWLLGKLESQPDSEGVNLGFPPVAQFIDALETGHGLPPAPLMGQICERQEYLCALWKAFDRLGKAKKFSVIDTVSRLPIIWQEAVRKHLRSKDAREHRYMLYSLLGVLASLIALPYFIGVYTASADEETTPVFILAMVATFMGLPAGLLLLGFYSSSRQNRRLLERLAQTGCTQH